MVLSNQSTLLTPDYREKVYTVFHQQNKDINVIFATKHPRKYVISKNTLRSTLMDCHLTVTSVVNPLCQDTVLEATKRVIIVKNKEIELKLWIRSSIFQ